RSSGIRECNLALPLLPVRAADTITSLEDWIPRQNQSRGCSSREASVSARARNFLHFVSRSVASSDTTFATSIANYICHSHSRNGASNAISGVQDDARGNCRARTGLARRGPDRQRGDDLPKRSQCLLLREL